MPNIIYVTPDGSEQHVDVAEGLTVMEGAVRNNLPGIFADCGGNISCATCHVYVDPQHMGLFGDASTDERDMLDFTEGVNEFSRLSCQMVVAAACADARVTVAGSDV